MKLRAICEKEEFSVSVGSGDNDLVWLACLIASLYGKRKHPLNNFVPTNLIIPKLDRHVHPRSKIKDLKLYEGDEIQITVREAGKDLTHKEKGNIELKICFKYSREWNNKAFGRERNIMTIRYRYKFDKQYLDKAKSKQAEIPLFFAKITYKMFPELIGEYSMKDIPVVREVQLEPIGESGDKIKLFAEVQYPFGRVTSELLMVIGKDDNVEKKPIPANSDFEIEFEPMPISRDEELKRKQEEFEKIPEMPDIIKAEAQMQGGETYEFKMDSKNPYTVEALWKIADWQFLDKGLAQDKLRKILAVEFDKIYEIFFNYTLFHVQKADKKENITITWQDLLFVLKFYEILPSSPMIYSFMNLYDPEGTRIPTVESSTDIMNGIDYPEFIHIILRAIYYHRDTKPEKERI